MSLARRSRAGETLAAMVLCVACTALVGAQAPARPGVPAAGASVSVEAVRGAIDQLGSLDYAARSKAAGIVRRAAAPMAVPALVSAATEHRDGYVRFRALVLLSGFSDPRGHDVMLQVLSDPNDRLREVAYSYFEAHPVPAMLPRLLQALHREESEFVRPALVRALAAHGAAEAKAQAALLVEVKRGQDFFRTTVIEALGDYKARYALDALIAIAKLDGPLQDDAAIAIGKIGEKSAVDTLAAVQRAAPRASQPAIATAICLLGINCSSHLRYVTEALQFAVRNAGYQELLRQAANGLAALAVAGNADALQALLDAAAPSTDPARAPMALAIGTVALRNAPFMMAVLEKRPDLPGALDLLREAFDMLEEDYEEERFFVAVRRAYWQSAEGSGMRRVAGSLIQTLEF